MSRILLIEDNRDLAFGLRNNCRVEMWRGGLGAVYPLPALSSAGASLTAPCFRFHIPLIELDGPISGIQLSEKESRFRPRKVAGPLGKPDQTKLVVQGSVRKLLDRRPRHLVFGAQPLAQPLTSVLLNRPVGVADRSQAEVVGPPIDHLVELPRYLLRLPLGLTAPGLRPDGLTDAHHSLLRWDRAQIGPSRLRRVASTKRIAQKVELLFRQLADPRLRLVHRQSQPDHHALHRGPSLCSFPTTADHEVVRVVDNARLKALLVPELPPPQHEPSHVDIAQQRAKRSSLRSSPSVIPIARTPMFIPFLVGLFNRSFQPHLD